MLLDCILRCYRIVYLDAIGLYTWMLSDCILGCYRIVYLDAIGLYALMLSIADDCFFLKANIFDCTGNQWVTCFQESAESILGQTAETIGRMRDDVSHSFLLVCIYFIYLFIRTLKVLMNCTSTSRWTSEIDWVYHTTEY